MPQRPKTISPHRAVAHLKRVSTRFTDQRRGSAAKRGYGHTWQKARNGYLAKHPMCVCCTANGHPMSAELVDHVVPHKGDKDLFWDSGNWQALCTWCHNNLKQSLERGWASGRVAVKHLNLGREVQGWLHPVER